jgi:hypothetical protein
MRATTDLIAPTGATITSVPTGTTDPTSTTLTTSVAGSVTTGRGPRAWALAGLGAGLAAAAMFVASMAVGTDLYDDETMADNAVSATLVADQRVALAAYIATATIAALLLIVFAAGLRRRLDAQCAPRSLVPGVATGGLWLAAALTLVGAGIGTELFWGLANVEDADPDSIMSMYHLVASLSWVWAGAGLSAAAIAVAAIRAGALPRWIGWVSAVGAGLMLGLSVIPLQYMSGMVGAVWLLVVSIGSLVSREHSV